jgi:hypothetical protein
MPLSGKHLIHAREISRAGGKQLAAGVAGMGASGKCHSFCQPGDAIQVSTITFPANINQEKHKANGRPGHHGNRLLFYLLFNSPALMYRPKSR